MTVFERLRMPSLGCVTGLLNSSRSAPPSCAATSCYGSDVDWVKNFLAAGSCSIETCGRIVELVEPELITDPELRPAPPHVRLVERRIACVTKYLKMRRFRFNVNQGA
jgi:hypothetical protein